MVDFGDRTAFEKRVGAARVVELFDDDGDGRVEGSDAETLAEYMGAASDIVAGLLLNKGFTEAQLEILKADRQVIHAWSGILAQLAGERKTEWLGEQGRGPYDAFGERARQELRALARGDIRSVQEDQTGPNPAVLGEVSVGDPVFVFNPDPRDPRGRGPGGF